MTDYQLAVALATKSTLGELMPIFNQWWKVCVYPRIEPMLSRHYAAGDWAEAVMSGLRHRREAVRALIEIDRADLCVEILQELIDAA